MWQYPHVVGEGATTSSIYIHRRAFTYLFPLFFTTVVLTFSEPSSKDRRGGFYPAGLQERARIKCKICFAFRQGLVPSRDCSDVVVTLEEESPFALRRTSLTHDMSTRSQLMVLRIKYRQNTATAVGACEQTHHNSTSKR